MAGVGHRNSQLVFCYLYGYDNKNLLLYASQLTPLTPSYKPRTPEKTFKQIKILASLRSKMSPEITSNDPRLLVFQI